MAGWSKIPHSIWDTDKLSLEEKTMLCFLIDRQNKFNTDWFGFSDNDFIKAGYGSNVSRWKPARDKLIQLGLISYKKQRGKKSQYKVNDVDSILEQEKEIVETKPLNKVEAQPKTKKEVLTQNQKEDLIKWYGILSTEDNDRYFNSSWSQFFDDYETAKIAANDYLRNNLKKFKGWLM